MNTIIMFTGSGVGVMTAEIIAVITIAILHCRKRDWGLRKPMADNKKEANGNWKATPIQNITAVTKRTYDSGRGVVSIPATKPCKKGIATGSIV